MVDHVEIPIQVEPGATPPEYATQGAAGMDLRCLEDFSLEPMGRQIVKTGLRVAIPEGFEAQVRPRSGLAARHGITMVNSPGTIDSDYRGEIGVILINLGAERVEFSAGERIGQLIIAPVVRAQWQLVETLESSERGEGGFGSTGTG